MNSPGMGMTGRDEPRHEGRSTNLCRMLCASQRIVGSLAHGEYSARCGTEKSWWT